MEFFLLEEEEFYLCEEGRGIFLLDQGEVKDYPREVVVE